MRIRDLPASLFTICEEAAITIDSHNPAATNTTALTPLDLRDFGLRALPLLDIQVLVLHCLSDEGGKTTSERVEVLL
jgi:hypothetical protein